MLLIHKCFSEVRKVPISLIELYYCSVIAKDGKVCSNDPLNLKITGENLLKCISKIYPSKIYLTTISTFDVKRHT